ARRPGVSAVAAILREEHVDALAREHGREPQILCGALAVPVEVDRDRRVLRAALAERARDLDAVGGARAQERHARIQPRGEPLLAPGKQDRPRQIPDHDAPPLAPDPAIACNSVSRASPRKSSLCPTPGKATS